MTAGALAACGAPAPETSSTDPVSSDPLAPPAPGPAPGAGAPEPDRMQWTLRTGADGPRLTYGEPATDNVGLSFRCDQPGRVTASFVWPETLMEGRDTFSLMSGGAQMPVEAETSPIELGENSVSVTGDFDVDAPLFRNFAETGWMALLVEPGSQPENMRADDAELSDVSAFIEQCGQADA